MPEAGAEPLLPSPGALSLGSLFQSCKEEVSSLVHTVCKVQSHLYRCSCVQQVVCGIFSFTVTSHKMCKCKLYANLLNSSQKAPFMQLKCWIMVLFSVGKQSEYDPSHGRYHRLGDPRNPLVRTVLLLILNHHDQTVGVYSAETLDVLGQGEHP